MQGRSYRIMVVDDDRGILEMFKDVFKEFLHGDVVSTATDGDDAVSKYAVLSPGPDVILMDERMPRMSGIDATRKILAMNSSARIVFVSADRTVEQKAIDAGARGFIQKPFGIDELKACLEKAMADVSA